MAGMIDDFEAAVLDYITSGAGGSISPTSWYVGLFTDNPNEAGTGFVEVVGGNYARFTMASGNWTPAAVGQPTTVSNNISIDFNTPSSSWGTVVGYGLFVASSGGNPQIWGPLNISRAVDTNEPVSFAIGDLKVHLGDPGDNYT